MRYALAVVCAYAMLVAPAVAQSTAIIRGTVTDARRETVVAGATVEISSPAIHELTVTDARGRFAFWTVPVGPVRVSARAQNLVPVSFLACAQAGVIDDLRIRLLTGIGSDAMYAFKANKNLDFRYNSLNPNVTADFYSIGAC